MRTLRLLVYCLAVGSLLSMGVPATAQVLSAGPAIYEGARLILGDGAAPIEVGAFVVQDGRITAIGRNGSVTAPAGATRIDLTGKTVMPAMVNLHAHVGFERFTVAGGESLPESFTPENILDHLQRQAFYGTGTVNDAGSAQVAMSQKFIMDQAAGEFPPAAQLVLMAGVVPVNGGPDRILIKGTRPLHANYEVTRSPEARAAVQDIAAKNVNQLKIWIGDRGGSYPAMPHEVYDAVIDEAHQLGIKVHSHAGSVRDQKDALRAGVDVIVHSIQREKVDDELMELVREKRPYWTTVMGLSDRSEVCDNDPFVLQQLPEVGIADILASNCNPNLNAATREENLQYNFTRMIEAGARLVLGTDAGVFPRYTFGSSDHHELMRYVELGLTPAEAIVAATSTPAEALGLTDVGKLAVGMRADFLVLNANPLEDISNTRQIASVYLRGAMLDREGLLAQWRRPTGTSF